MFFYIYEMNLYFLLVHWYELQLFLPQTKTQMCKALLSSLGIFKLFMCPLLQVFIIFVLVSVSECVCVCVFYAL